MFYDMDDIDDMDVMYDYEYRYTRRPGRRPDAYTLEKIRRNEEEMPMQWEQQQENSSLTEEIRSIQMDKPDIKKAESRFVIWVKRLFCKK